MVPRRSSGSIRASNRGTNVTCMTTQSRRQPPNIARMHEISSVIKNNQCHGPHACHGVICLKGKHSSEVKRPMALHNMCGKLPCALVHGDKVLAPGKQSLEININSILESRYQSDVNSYIRLSEFTFINGTVPDTSVHMISDSVDNT